MQRNMVVTYQRFGTYRL